MSKRVKQEMEIGIIKIKTIKVLKCEEEYKTDTNENECTHCSIRNVL